MLEIGELTKGDLTATIGWEADRGAMACLDALLRRMCRKRQAAFKEGVFVGVIGTGLLRDEWDLRNGFLSKGLLSFFALKGAA